MKSKKKKNVSVYSRRQQHQAADHSNLATLAAPNAMFAALSAFSLPINPIPTLISQSGIPAYDLIESNFSQLALKTLGGFVIILTEWGDVYYVSENIEQYLGFCQSDVLHQPIIDMLHSEDRDNILKNLKVQAPKFKGNLKFEVEYDSMERNLIGRFRCLLDNTCGFVASSQIEIFLLSLFFREWKFAENFCRCVLWHHRQKKL